MADTNTPTQKLTYEQRVRQLEQEGCTTSDAQGVADLEEMKGLLAPSDSAWTQFLHRQKK